MAGESPGKVEREKSSGEATEEHGAVAPGKGGKAADAGGGPEGDAVSNGDSGRTSAEGTGNGTGGDAGEDRLKAAVAAWVAGPDDSGTTETPGSADDAPEAAGTAKESGQTTSSDLPVRPRSSERPSKGAPAGPVDQPTAMFQVLDEGSAGRSASETDEDEAVRRAERMTAAFFGSSKAAGTSGTSEEDEDEDGAGDGPTADETAGQGEEAEAPEVDEPTAVFRTREAEADEDAGEPADEAPEVDEPTAVFRARETDADEPSGKSAAKPSVGKKAGAAGSGDAKTGAAGSGDVEAGGEPRVDEPTAAFRTRGPAGTAAKKTSGAAPAKKPDEGDDGAKPDPRLEHRVSGRKPDEPAEGDEPSGEPAKSDEDAKSGAANPGSAKTGAPGKSGASGGSGPEEAGSAKSGSGSKESGASGAATADRKSESSGGSGAGRTGSAKSGSDVKSGAAKAGSAKSGASGAVKAGGKSGVERAPLPEESDSERTSQFVPLKSGDVPKEPKKQGPVVPPKPLGGPRSKGGGGSAVRPPSAGAMPDETMTLSEAELTRQQPRPDQAPIDLLAQLTNTPPPRETPLRTAVRRVKIWTPLVLLVALVFMVVQGVRPLPEPELKLTADATYTFEGSKPAVPWPSEGQAVLDVEGLGSFGSYGKEKPVPIASVAKVMTAYVILRDHPVKKGEGGEIIPVDQKAEDEAGLSAQNESTVEVKKGDKITQREAVQAIMIASANNVARLLARWDAGSEGAFVKKMNAAAKDLGMKNTKYTDPSGLTASTVSTAADQVKLGKKAMGIDLFAQTARMPSYADTKGDKHGNWNRLVPLDGVVGIKTGTTTKAGGNLLFAAEKEIGGTKQLIIGAVLGQYRPSILDTVLGESKKLIDAAQDAMTARKVVKKGDVVGYADDGLDGRTPLVATRDVTAVGWPGLKVELGLTDDGKVIPNEAAEGDEVGTLTVGDGPGQVKVPVALAEDSAEPGFGARMSRIL